MNSSSAKLSGKNTLPFIIASIACGYATNMIPEYFQEGELRNWAYRSIPALSLCILYIIRFIKDIGSMSISQIIFNFFCAGPEKKRLKAIIDDTYNSNEVRDEARVKYSEISRSEIAMNSKLMTYLSNWFQSTPKKSELPNQEP